MFYLFFSSFARKYIFRSAGWLLLVGVILMLLFTYGCSRRPEHPAVKQKAAQALEAFNGNGSEQIRAFSLRQKPVKIPTRSE